MCTPSQVVRLPSLLQTAAILLCGAGPASAQFTVPRFTIDGGGTTRSSGGTFALGGTVGQPDAGRLAGGSFTLSGGFWSGGGVVATAVDDSFAEGAGLPNAALPAFRLYPARPNPVAPGTTLLFDLPVPGFVRAALYDVSGRLVRVLANEVMEAGRHERAWDRRDGTGRLVSSGIYFLRLDAGSNRSRQKIVVVS
jgi:hypothetical protein